MNTYESDEELAFRTRAKSWLVDHLPAGWENGDKQEPTDADERLEFRLAWHKKLYQGGWLGLTWPKEWGGQGLNQTYQLIFNEELALHETPPMASWVGIELLGPTLLEFGSTKQKLDYLPGVLSGQDIWCQGFSEPDAGSDLFSIKGTATKIEGGWRLDGRKKWTSWAQYSKYCLVLMRTGSENARDKALSTFIMPMDAVGLTVVETKMIDGDKEENELIMDGVVLPHDALVGSLNAGAQVVMRNMAFARGIGTIERTLILEMILKKLRRSAKVLPSLYAPAYDRGDIRSRLANLHSRIQALKFMGYRKVSEMEEGGAKGPVASVEKLVWAETNQALSRLAMDIIGPGGLLETTDLGDGTWPGYWLKEFFRSRGGAIEGGSNEIQKNTIAKRVLNVFAA